MRGPEPSPTVPRSVHAGPAPHQETGMSYDSPTPRPARAPRGHPSSFARHIPDPAAAEPLRGGASPRARTGHHRDLRILRRAYRRQRRVTTFVVLGCFTLFLGLTAGCPSLMERPVTGGLPTGLVVALAQIPATWLAVLVYERTARRYVDPLARRVNRSVPWAGGEQERNR
ncbi:DUF485 domain-containing protein [Streptomyces aureus]|uniref:DUF485 domain-containing protein n=1 Tax=Streptomyces aureus TaxID=193461 RepID=UPI0036758FCF